MEERTMKALKRILACLLAVLMLVGMLSTSAFAATSFTAGDVNDDNKVNLLDVAIALRLLAGYEYNGTFEPAAMFLSGDPIADLADAVLMLRVAAGWSNVSVTPMPAGAKVSAPTAEKANYHYGSTVSILSQNLLHSSTPGARAECFRTEVATYQPDVIAMQEYRDAWEYLVAGATGSSALASMAKVKSLGNYGEVLSSGDALYNNQYNYVVNTTNTSLLGSGYQGYVQTRADITKEIYTGAAQGATALANYRAAKETNPNADPKDYAPHVDESLAIFWNTDKLTLVDQGRFIISEDGSFSANPGKDPEVTFKNDAGSIVAEENATYMYFGDARLCVWVRLKDANGTEFYVFNAHGPNVGDTTEKVAAEMIPSMEIILEQIAKVVNEEDIAVMLAGDLNVNYGASYDLPAWAVLEESFNDIAVQMYGEKPQGSRAPRNDAKTAFSGIETDANGNWRITIRPDYFFAKDNGRIFCEKYKTNLDVYSSDGTSVVAQFNPTETASLQGTYVGDHFGIYGEFNIA